jgi:Ca2+-binding EF-hand superfamily protein
MLNPEGGIPVESFSSGARGAAVVGSQQMQKITALVAASVLFGAAGYVLAGEGGEFKGKRGRHGRGDRQAILEKFDANKNGMLDPDEREAAREAGRARMAEHNEKRLERFDANKNGVLDPEEREAARAEGKARHEKHRAEMLEKFDADKNGTLEPEERKAARAAHEARREELKKQFDTDGDGKLSDSERDALREHMRQEGGRRH